MSEGDRWQMINTARVPRFTTVGEYTKLPVLDGEAIRRDGVVVFRLAKPEGAKEVFAAELSGEAFVRDRADPVVMAPITLDKTELMPIVDKCRRAWNDVVDRSQQMTGLGGLFGRTDQPLVNRVKQKGSLPNDVANELARAGNDLFNVLFRRNHPRLDAWTDRFVAGLHRGPCLITVYSDAFFIPWGMLYIDPPGRRSVHEDGVACDKTGFLGYSHIIEHATDSFVPTAAIGTTDARLDFGFTFDEHLDQQQRLKSVAQQRRYFEGIDMLRRHERSSREDVEKAFRRQPFTDQISYFFVHGETSDVGKAGQTPRFLIAGQAIDAADINAWAGNGPLGSQPLLFFNACQTGQMRSLFYESFAFQLLEKQARGLIGPQIDMPTLFAQEYAKRLFDRLLAKGQGKARLGGIVRDLARQFWDEDNNPLGLAYSLFKGADCYIRH